MAWIEENWFTVLSAIGIIGSLLFTAVSLRSETKTRRIENLLTLTQGHRELWSKLFGNEQLGRVLSAEADLAKKPITRDEATFVNMIIQHLSAAYQALKSGLVIKPEGLRRDVRLFFSLPIPVAIWNKLKDLQNDDFVRFVDGCLPDDA